MKKQLFLFIVCSLFSVIAAYGNIPKVVTQVTGSVDILDNLDYTITSTTPFTTVGSVNITNTEHAVVIISKIKPSKVISDWLNGHVYINGEQAENEKNCQIKMYGNGTIILPYEKNIKPLTVYSEQNYGGTAINDFGLENDGGFMNTLTEAKLNNKIRSFKLKRGYMVTFSTRAKGRGYSRCFIADKADLEVSTLSLVLDQKITSYRIFKWYDTGKHQLAAAGGDMAACAALNVTSTYTWGTTSDMSPDIENVPHHIYENYPSPASLGECTTSPHMKTNNEPMNKDDDPKGKTESIDQVLANWEDLMATGMRLCSPSSWDGSDYTNGTGYIKNFIDSIDARGWRCDIIDLHCYWPESNFGTIRNWTNSTGRPVWISEWVWGASWNNNGAFANGVTEEQNAETLKRICPVLNDNDCIERYYYWNGERDPSKIYKNSSLTVAGEYYSTIDAGLGYNGKYNFVPKNPRQYKPGELQVVFDKNTKKATLLWRDNNGEYNQSMEIEYKKPGTTTWVKVADVVSHELPDDYEEVIDGVAGNVYRIHIVDLNGDEYYTNEATAVNENLSFGDEVSVTLSDGSVVTRYLGGNILLNGSFDLGYVDWENGQGNQLTPPYFQVVPVGGYNNSSYLQCFGDCAGTARTDATAILRVIPITKGDCFYAQAAGNNNGSGYNTQLIGAGTSSRFLKTILKMSDVTQWTKAASAFQAGYSYIWISMTNLGGKAQFDEIFVGKLWETKDEALADALQCEKNRAEAFKQFNTKFEGLNNEITSISASATSATQLEEAIKKQIEAYYALCNADSVRTVAGDIIKNKMAGYEGIQTAFDMFNEASSGEEIVATYNALKEVSEIANFSYNNAISSPTFASVADWNVKAGTYTAGDQKVATVSGKKCWNAWWGISTADVAGRTLEINQDIASTVSSTKLPHGLYALECDATTQHLCESNQHAFLTNVTTGESVNSFRIPYGIQDLPQFDNADVWCKLVTPYVYFGGTDAAKIGFASSKENAVDGAWMPYNSPTSKGDNREGWWCATDFKLRYIPMLIRTTDSEGWGTICLQYSFDIPDGIKIYKLTGLTSDYEYVCMVEEKDEIKQGRPYIFKGEPNTDYIFYEKGNPVTTVQRYNGLWGEFASTRTYPIGTIVLTDGKWYYNSVRGGKIVNFGAYILAIDNLTILDSWDGEKLPTANMPEAPTAIKSVKSAQDSNVKSDDIYDLSGRRANADAKGIIIENGIKKAK